MSLYFRSLCSSSSGNCLLIRSRNTQIAIDCGFRAQRDCIASIGNYAGGFGALDAVLVSHAHTDHIGHAGLRVLGKNRVRIMAHGCVAEQVRDRHVCDGWEERPIIEAFDDDEFDIGDLRITPIELPHDPEVATFGFVIHHGSGKSRRKLIVCTDFYDYADALPHFIDADFMFVESNHDLGLLRKYPNPASHYHLSNPKTAKLLCEAVRKSKVRPRAVMLGHLSHERNREKLAIGEVRGAFDRRKLKIEFNLSTAPLYEASESIAID
jgi:phosphoribosyl 1,2-cyclic phosphodiesterase